MDEHTHEEMLYRIATLEEKVAEQDRRLASLEAALGMAHRA